jgi:hypothetical protein
MKYLLFATLALAVTPAWATAPVSVPEMDVGAGVGAIALLIGIAAIIREKSKRK